VAAVVVVIVVVMAAAIFISYPLDKICCLY
jgi:hypothetical protein